MATQLNKSMVSEVSIANQALGFLGSNPIISFDEPSTSAQLMRDQYPFIRDAVMTEFAWTFAAAEVKSITADLSTWGDKFSHPIPLDWLQVLRVFRRITVQPLVSEGWTRQGSFILTDENTVYMWGIQRITDTALFSPEFVQCLATRLAADLCMAITENMVHKGQLFTEYAAKIDSAAASDGVQGANEVISGSKLISVRNSGGFGTFRGGLI